MTKFPIWIKSKGKYELIPYHLMTTFEDGSKGFLWPQIRRDKATAQYISDNKKYFTVKRIKKYAPPPNQKQIIDTEYRIILLHRPKIRLPRRTFELGIGLNLGCSFLNLMNIWLKSPYWSTTYGLIGIAIGLTLSTGFIMLNFRNGDYILRAPTP